MDNMNISSAQYVSYMGKTACITAVIDGTEMSVPIDLSNRHYFEIMRQVEAGTLTIQETP